MKDLDDHIEAFNISLASAGRISCNRGSYPVILRPCDTKVVEKLKYIVYTGYVNPVIMTIRLEGKLFSIRAYTGSLPKEGGIYLEPISCGKYIEDLDPYLAKLPIIDVLDIRTTRVHPDCLPNDIYTITSGHVFLNICKYMVEEKIPSADFSSIHTAVVDNVLLAIYLSSKLDNTKVVSAPFNPGISKIRLSMLASKYLDLVKNRKIITKGLSARHFKTLLNMFGKRAKTSDVISALSGEANDLVTFTIPRELDDAPKFELADLGYIREEKENA